MSTGKVRIERYGREMVGKKEKDGLEKEKMRKEMKGKIKRDEMKRYGEENGKKRQKIFGQRELIVSVVL
jgi:hypothetical protein